MKGAFEIVARPEIVDVVGTVEIVVRSEIVDVACGAWTMWPMKPMKRTQLI
jgi:hypothetical protein